MKFWKDPTTQDEAEWRRFGKKIRELVGDDPDIVFEHPGRETFGASVYVARKGGWDVEEVEVGKLLAMLQDGEERLKPVRIRRHSRKKAR